MPEADARKYASEIGAIFRLTSACTASGIEELFKSIGCKFLDPSFKDGDDTGAGSSSAQGSSGGAVKLDPKKTVDDKKKKGCC